MRLDQKITQYIWYSKSKFSYFVVCIFVPFSIIYYLLFLLKKIQSNEKSFQTKIVCIGNCSVGGDGKTSTVLSLINLYKSRNIKVAVLLKGYKGKIKVPTKVNMTSHSAVDVGDEALLYVEHASTFVSNDRIKGINFIISQLSPDVILIDDGLQDFRIKKDKSILVINGKRGFGNGFLLPVGPLRQSPSSAIKLADIIIIIGDDKGNYLDAYKSKFKNKLFLKAEITCEKNQINKNYFAFSGIGNNPGFINTLDTNNYNLTKIKSFPDHYYYKDNDIKNIKKYANDNDLEIITTKKDWKRLNTKQRLGINFLQISLKFSDNEALSQIIMQND
jgi:tetraacyldisaccharide 4'-kinase